MLRMLKEKQERRERLHDAAQTIVAMVNQEAENYDIDVIDLLEKVVELI